MIGLLAACAVGLGSPTAVTAATTERVIVDRNTGLAIDGFDPVAYFTDGTARHGDPEFEVGRDGAIWRFCNDGNRKAFVARSDVYAPRFGGYDPVGVARGVPLQGNPLVWLIEGRQLYLFSSEDSRAAFAADPERYLGAAQQQWPALLGTLAQ